MTTGLDEKSEWIEIRRKLNQQYTYDSEWENAINLFDTRLKRKFFKPIGSIINKRTLQGEGFTIVTAQCALIEMFAAFKAGKIFNPDSKKKSAKYEYSRSKQIFTDFLLTESIFEDNFWQYNGEERVVKNQPYNAKGFYEDVRCGLMHEARTKGDWTIGATPSTKSVITERKFIVTVDGKIKIYRTVLHHRLLHYLTDYQEKLRQNNQDGEILRKNFARKLDHLFDFEPDTKDDWWRE